MICLPKSSADSLPDEILATILKLVADLPVLASRRTRPAPVAASRVSRRWRIVALGSPELWTNIRISHRPWSWTWAAVFVKRSLSYPLNITINLEAWRYSYGEIDEAPIPLDRALAIVGPHINRWRTFALRAFPWQFEQLATFVGQSTVLASQLESAHLSSIYGTGELRLGNLLGGQSFRDLRIRRLCIPSDMATFNGLRSLDITFSVHVVSAPEFRQLFGPLSQLTTLIIRKWWHRYEHVIEPIDGSTIQSLVIDFSEHLYESAYRDVRWPGFESFTNIFSLPNVEHLEIIGGFSGSRRENYRIPLPEEREAPLFPHLRVLRLEDVGFSRHGLAFIQCFSCNISSLQLVYTKGMPHLLTNPAAWPALRELTVEMAAGVVDLEWLAPFVVTRASLGMPLSDITIPPWVQNIASRLMVVQPVPAIHWQRPGPSPGLMDGHCGPGFYIDEYDMRAVDFEHVPFPPIPTGDIEGWFWQSGWVQMFDERLEEEIEWELKMGAEALRVKGMFRKLRKERNKRTVSSRAKERRSSKPSYDFGKDFSVA
ncbi:hypothetical protein DFH06DRAFT_1239695 [Mycena polygramma]|nr:hypothetical protein DFH06DRAFT_1239695 [Mycena polygramma]